MLLANLISCTASWNKLRIDLHSIPTPDYLLRIAAKSGQAGVLHHLFDSLPECRHRRPWLPNLPDRVNWDEVPQKWEPELDGVAAHAAIEGADPIKLFEVFFDYGMSVKHHLERAISLLACAIGYNKFEFAKFLL